MQRLHAYPDLRTMLRRLLFAAITGMLAALAVAGFRHAMLFLEWLFLSNDTGSLVNAATGLSAWRRVLTPALGGFAAGMLLWGWQRLNQQRPHAPTDYMEALRTDGQFDYGASLVKSLASLLVVVSGSAIGREGAMILLAALLAATTHAPIMSTLMICEMTGQYSVLPGLLIACVLASVLSRTLRQDSIYREHVAQHG